MKKTTRIAAASLFVVLLNLHNMNGAQAATKTANLQVSAVVGAECTIDTVNNMSFGTYDPSATNKTSTTIEVTCTNNENYNIGLNGGTSGDVNARVLTRAGGDTLNYELTQDSAGNTNWGNTVGVDTLQLTGTGNSESTTIYGEIAPGQNGKQSGNYSDTVVITVTY